MMLMSYRTERNRPENSLDFGGFFKVTTVNLTDFAIEESRVTRHLVFNRLRFQNGPNKGDTSSPFYILTDSVKFFIPERTEHEGMVWLLREMDWSLGLASIKECHCFQIVQRSAP